MRVIYLVVLEEEGNLFGMVGVGRQFVWLDGRRSMSGK